jgi:hypothetical protein
MTGIGPTGAVKLNKTILALRHERTGGEAMKSLPYKAAGPFAARLLKNGTLKTYTDYPHGMITTQADVINADLLAFIKA